MAFYRVTHAGAVDGAHYQVGDVLDLGDASYAGLLSQTLGLVEVDKPQEPDAPEPEPVSEAPEVVVVAPQAEPRRARRKRQ